MWKHRVKKDYYLAHETDDERKKNLPPNVQPADWEKLIKYFGMQAIQNRAELNKECRGTPVAVNRTGRISHDCIRHELKKEGKPTDRITVWKKSRLKKDGTFDEKDGAKDLEELLNSKLDELSEDQNKDEEEREKIFVDVIGSDGHGRVRTLGIGVTPSMIKSRPSSTLSYTSEIEKIRLEYEERIERLEGEFDEKLRKACEEQRALVIREVMHQIKNRGGTSSSQNIHYAHAPISSVSDVANGESHSCEDFA